MTFQVDVSEVEKAARMLGTLEHKTQTIVNAAARKGATVQKKAVKRSSPSTRISRHLAVSRVEKHKAKGKAVFRVGIEGGDEANGELQLPIKNPGSRGGSGKAYGYLPHSLEYGYYTGDGHGGFRKVEGQHFADKASSAAAMATQQVIVESIMTKVEKEWAKR